LDSVVRDGRRRLFEAREARVKPGRDEKILTAWNGLMLRSFAEASNSLDREDYRHVAVRNAEFLLSNLFRDEQLLRSYKDGQARFNAYLDDYACLTDGLISLYESTFDPRWVSDALRVAEAMISKFRDEQGKDFYFTSGDHEKLIHRPKEFIDNATPSGNSVAAFALLRLSELTGDPRWSGYAISILQNMTEPMQRQPSAFPHLLCALDFYLGRPSEIAVIGDPGEDGTRALLKEIYRRYLPNKVVACGTDGGLLLLRDRARVNGGPTAYVCENFSCRLPVTDAADLSKILDQRGTLNPQP